MARTGLRMMPTFPPPPLKFRTVSFPQYGFKASLSDPACPGRREVKPAPGIPSGLGGFAVILRAPPDYAIHCTPVPSPEGQSGGTFPAGCAADPRGPWLRSEFCCLGPSLLSTTPSASLAGTVPLHESSSLIGTAFAVRERRGDPRDLPYFPWRAVRTCRRPYPGGSAGPSRYPGAAIPGSLELRASRHPHPRLCQQSPTGVPFEAASFASCCGPCVCPALLAGYDAVQVCPAPRLLRYRVTPAFGTGRRRAVLGVRLDGRTGNLPSSGLSPD